MKQQRKTYTEDFKLETIRLYENSQKSAAQIETDLDLPTGIIHKWRRRLKANGQQPLSVKATKASLRRKSSGCNGNWRWPVRSGIF